MWRFFAVVGAASTAGAAVLGVPWVWLSIPAGAMLASLAWRYRCPHREPLALLPPVTEASGERLPARWFCDRCGQTWPIELEHDRKPVPKYVGFDEKKALRAAERAVLLEEQRRSIAMQRAGLTRPRIQRKRRAHNDPVETPVANVVPISDIRGEIRRQA
jgi:hypothetical protein